MSEGKVASCVTII
jgi:DNA mismatch repair ATPase MutS